MADAPERFHTAPQSEDEKVARADALRHAADESARLVRTLVVSFLLVGVYVAIIVFGTTDVQLLKETPVRLPFFEVGVPLVGFYAVVPWVIVLLHLNLLLQLTLLSRKLHAFDAAVREIGDPRARRDQRDRLYAFPFSDMLAGRHDSALLRTLLAAIVWSTVLILPLALLIAAQVRFLPYRSDAVTAWQGLAVLATLAALWALWPVAVTGRSWREWGAWAVGFVTVGEVVAARRSQLGGRRSRPKAARRWRRRFRDGSMGYSLASLGLATLVVAVPALLMATGISRDGWFRTYLVLREAVLVRGEPPVEVVTALRSDDAQAISAALDRVRGLDLRDRDLSGAIFGRAVIPKVDLRGATLTGADLSLATLTDADLSLATLTEANLHRAMLTNANLTAATLTEANLSGASLAEAKLMWTTLTRANLRETTLTDANLQRTTLTGSDLSFAKLDHADLSRAILTKVDLVSANLTEADLSNATLAEADLRGAEFSDARFFRSNLDRVMAGCLLLYPGLEQKCTNFRGAQMAGASLDGADLRRALFDSETLAGTCGTDVLLPDGLEGGTPACVEEDLLNILRGARHIDEPAYLGPGNSIHQD